MRIDAHHHFWRYDPVQYDWISESMRAIRRDFLPADLHQTITAAGIDGVISVQARQCLEETQCLLDFATAHSFIRGVVGWLPLTAETLSHHLERFAQHPKLCALRHVVQGEPDGFMLRDDFNRGISELRRHDLAYDILVIERQLPEAIPFVDRHPDQRFILDHIAKPRIKDNLVEPWATNLRELARRENVYCKLSGMVTEADFTNWTEAQLRLYMDIALDAFGPSRLMFGSDWPVCLVACDYSRWVSLVDRFVSTLSPTEQRAIWSDNALAAYGIQP